MTRFPWGALGQDEQKIVDGRLSDMMRTAFAFPSAYSFDAARNAALVELVAASRPRFNVRSYGAGQGDGVTPVWRAFQDALNAAGAVKGVVIVPDPLPGLGYFLEAMLTVPVDTALVGATRGGTRLIHGYNGIMVDMLGGARLENLWLDGNGAIYTGRGINLAVGHGRQTGRSLKVVDFADYCIDFAHEAAGSQSYWEDLITYRLDGDAEGEEAVIVRGALTATANPRIFVGVRTEGKAFIDLGPCNNLFMLGCRVDGVKWSDNSRGVTIMGGRIGANIATMAVKGAGHAIDGTHIGPAIELAPGLSNTKIDGPYDSTITDNSGNDTNLVTQRRTSYTPSFSASGGSPALGNGTITGTYWRSGTTIFFTIEFTVGSTTNLGSGELRFGLPITRINADVLQPGQAIINDSGTQYIAVAQIPNNVGYVRLVRDSGLVTGASPAALGTGDTIRMTGAYTL